MGVGRPRAQGEQLLIDDSYELLSLIGRGGNSLVYTAQPTPEVRSQLGITAETVVVKLFTDSAAAPGMTERIQREAMCLKAFNHPRIIKIFDYCASLELSYIVLEHAPLGDVKGLMEEYGKIELRTALRFGIQLLDALSVVHNAGILHRDVKPENLLLAEDKSVRLSDFGVSKFLYGDAAFETDDIVRGTLGYIASEQLQGGVETVATDIFAAAVTIFEMITGQLPFAGESLTVLLGAMLQGNKRSVVPYVGERFKAIDKVLAKGLETDPAGRYQSALEFRRALEEIIWGIEQESQSSSRQKKIEVRLSGSTMLSSSPELEIEVEQRSASQDLTGVPVFLTQHKRSFKWISGIALAAVLSALVMLGKGSATANLRRAESASLADSSSEWLSSLFFTSHEAYEQAQTFANAPHAGVLYNFLADGQNVLFSTSPTMSENKDSFVLSVALPGWKPQIVSLSPTAKSRELIINAGGMQIALEISKINRESGAVISGRYRDLNTGRESRWAAF